MPNQSRAKIQSWIDSGAVTVNGEVRSSSYKVKLNDVINVEEVQEDEVCCINPDKDVQFKIVFEDDDIIVVDKPAGVTVHPGAGNYDHTLVNGLAYHCGENLSTVNSELRPGIVHRIDKDTSGILVVAKNDFAHMNLAKQFELHTITRKYVCFVFGVLRPISGQIETLIARDPRNRLRMAVDQHSGKRAVTIYSTLKTYGMFASKVECELLTGRTHQIRVHLSHLGHSLIGDKLYKVKNYSLPKEIAGKINSFDRQALHAKFLEFVHPRTQETMTFESEIPADIAQLEQIMQNYREGM